MIISDATTIITLINIDEFNLLKLFTKKVILPTEVYDEVVLNVDAEKHLLHQIEQKFVEVLTYKNEVIFSELNIILDRGESAAITLAIENKRPLIIDEKKGRAIAKQLEVEIIGLIGILRFLYLEKKLNKDQTQIIIDKLNKSSFRISKSLIKIILDEKH